MGCSTGDRKRIGGFAKKCPLWFEPAPYAGACCSWVSVVCGCGFIAGACLSLVLGVCICVVRGRVSTVWASVLGARCPYELRARGRGVHLCAPFVGACLFWVRVVRGRVSSVCAWCAYVCCSWVRGFRMSFVRECAFPV